LELNPGDIVAFDRLTVHGSGPNMTNINRVAYAVQFHRYDTTILENGKPRLLKTHPRWTDIYGAFEIVKDESIGRDGH
jgi:ectoine hydroxylase-related dioxygenase (phytanoyl-CoA dioxygenase family)